MTIERVYKDRGCKHGIECVVVVIQVIYLSVLTQRATAGLGNAMFGLLPRKLSKFRRLYLSPRTLTVCLDWRILRLFSRDHCVSFLL